MKLAALGISLLVLVSGCDKIAEKLGQKVGEKAVEGASGGDVKVDTSSGSVSVTDKKTGTTSTGGDNVKLPAGWPSNVPLYPGARIGHAMVSGSTKSVTLVTKDPPAKVAEFYKKSGLKLESDMNLGAIQTMSFKNGSGTVNVILQQAGADTQISISIVG